MLHRYICLTLFDILHALISCHLYMLDVMFVLTLVFNQESYSSTSTLSLEES